MWSITVSSGLLFILGPIMPSAMQSMVIPDIVAPTGDERRALEIKKNTFWEPFVKTAEEAAPVGHGNVYAAVEASIGALPNENTHVRSLLEDALARLRAADAQVSQQILQASEVASEHLADIPDSQWTASSFLSTGQSIVAWAFGRIVGGGRYSERVNEQVASRQTDLLPTLRGASSVDVLEECREVAKIGFDVLKYDVYSQNLASTPEIALTAANRLIQASDETRHRFLKSVEGTADVVAKDTSEKDADPSAVVTSDLVSEESLAVGEEFHDKGPKDVPSNSVSNESSGFAHLVISKRFGHQSGNDGLRLIDKIGASSHITNYTVREDLESLGEETHDQGASKTNHRSLPSQALLEAKARVEVAWANAKAGAEAEQAEARAEVEVSQSLARAEARAAEAQARARAEVAKTWVKMEAGGVHAQSDIKEAVGNHAESLSDLAPDFWAHVQADSQDEQDAMTKDAMRTLMSEWEPHGQKVLSNGTGVDEEKDEHLAIIKQTVSTGWEEFGLQSAIKEQDSRLNDTRSSMPTLLSEWHPARRNYKDLAMDTTDQKNTTSAIVSKDEGHLEPFGHEEREDGAGLKTVYRSAVTRPILPSKRESLFGGPAPDETANEADSVSKMARALFTDWEPARTRSGVNMERDTVAPPTIIRKTLLSRISPFGHETKVA